MGKKLVIVTLLLTVFLYLNSRNTFSDPLFADMSPSDIEIIDSKVQLYYFYSDKCAGCKIQTPIIRILRTRGFNFEILKKSEETQAKFDEFKVKVYPTILIITPNETIRLEGFQPIRKLIKVLLDVKNEKVVLERYSVKFAYYGVNDDLQQFAKEVAILVGSPLFIVQNDSPLIQKYKITVKPTLLVCVGYQISKIEDRVAIKRILRKFKYLTSEK